MAKNAVANALSSLRVSRIELDGSERILQLFNHWIGPPSIKTIDGPADAGIT